MRATYRPVSINQIQNTRTKHQQIANSERNCRQDRADPMHVCSGTPSVKQIISIPSVVRHSQSTPIHFNTGEGGLVFLGIGIGVVLATLIFIVMDRMIYRRKTLRRRTEGDFTPLPPEERLWPAMLGSVLLPISLFWFG